MVKIIEKWEQTEKTIKQLLNLTSKDIVMNFGYEHLLSDKMYDEIKKSYTLTSLYVRTQPDWLIYKDHGSFFIEFKSKVKALEAIQLFFNQQRAKSGIDIKYLFPNGNLIDCLDIPFENEQIIVPANYADEFKNNLWPTLKLYNKQEPKYIKTMMKQPISGDPFIGYTDWEKYSI